MKKRLEINDIERHKMIMDMLHKTYIDKNHDYGNSVHDTYLKYGMVSFLVRIEDKLNRARTILTTDRKVSDETVIDTLLDLANYSILAVMEYEKEDVDEC